MGGEAKLPDLLAERGARAEWAVWDDASVAWDAYDLVAVRCTWDYPQRPAAFTAWVRQVALGTQLVNAPQVIVGNLHKGYLPGLGADAVPSMIVPVGMTVDLDRLGWPAVVVKPAIAVGGDRAVRHATQKDLEALTLADPGVDAVVQPYLGSVEADGETSLVVIEGEVTHAIGKRPAAGEFRTQEHRGGTAELVPIRPEDVAVAQRVVSRLSTPPVVARVDLLHDRGRPLVSELELIEPYLWLELAPAAADRLADALVRRARGRKSVL